MMLVMTFRNATRLILAGDPLQLTGLLLDKRSRSIWKKVYLQDVGSKYARSDSSILVC